MREEKLRHVRSWKKFAKWGFILPIPLSILVIPALGLLLFGMWWWFCDSLETIYGEVSARYCEERSKMTCCPK